jgi:hypothetical protein
MAELKYKPAGTVLRDFLMCDDFVRGCRGPVGSGKSVGCCIEIFRRASQQERGTDGIRRTKWAVIRNTNPELRTTTIATWLQWFPENEWGAFRWSPPFTHHIRKGDIDLEVLFLPLDTPEDVKKLLSLELTGVFINEAREVPKAIIDAATSRVGRFPSLKDGVGPTWYGVIMDTNAPETEHWWPIMSGETPVPDHISEEQALMLIKPDNWTFFTQPPGMLEDRGENNELMGYKPNPLAENYHNLPPAYYDNMIRGKMKSWIDVYVLNLLGSTAEGKPVYQGFAEKTHVAVEPIMIAPMQIYCGIDFGLTPAAAFMQRLPSGRWLCVGELVCADMGAKRFAEVLRRFVADNFPDNLIAFYGDPTGDYRAQTDETTPFQIMRAGGINVLPSPSNDPVIRVEAVNQILSRMVDGEPGFLIHKKTCPALVTGFLGGYHYRRLQVSGERYEDRPNKNKFSHIHDGLQYAILGAGEGRELVRGPRPMQPGQAKPTQSFHARRAKQKRRVI